MKTMEREAIERRLNSISPRGVGMKGQAGPSGLTSGHLSAGDLAHIQVPTPRIPTDTPFARLTPQERSEVVFQLVAILWKVNNEGRDDLRPVVGQLKEYICGYPEHTPGVRAWSSEEKAWAAFEESWREYGQEVGR